MWGRNLISMLRVSLRNNGRELALKACKRYFVEFPCPPDWQVPDDRQMLRWIDSCWMNESDIQKVRDLKEDSR